MTKKNIKTKSSVSPMPRVSLRTGGEKKVALTLDISSKVHYYLPIQTDHSLIKSGLFVHTKSYEIGGST